LTVSKGNFGASAVGIWLQVKMNCAAGLGQDSLEG